MRYLNLYLLISSLFILCGCSEPTIDTSSDEKMRSSIAKVKASLPEEQKEDFEDAIMLVSMGGIDFSNIFQLANADSGAIERKMKDALHGKTGIEVIDLGKKVYAEREQEYIIEELLSEARELRMDGNYEKVIAKYNEVLSLESNSEETQKGLEEIEKEIEASKVKIEYIKNIKLYDFEAINDDYLFKKAGMSEFMLKLKNEGDKTLTKVKVTVYLKDKDDKIISEGDSYPILITDSSYSLNDDKPLKPGYIFEGRVILDNIPSEWEVGNAKAMITGIEFEE